MAVLVDTASCQNQIVETRGALSSPLLQRSVPLLGQETAGRFLLHSGKPQAHPCADPTCSFVTLGGQGSEGQACGGAGKTGPPKAGQHL